MMMIGRNSDERIRYSSFHRTTTTRTHRSRKKTVSSSSWVIGFLLLWCYLAFGTGVVAAPSLSKKRSPKKPPVASGAPSSDSSNSPSSNRQKQKQQQRKKQQTQHQRRRKRRGEAKHERMTPEERLDEILLVIQYMTVLVVSPVIIQFLYRIVTDPDVPTLLYRATQRIVVKMFTGYLRDGSESSNSKRKS